MTYGVTPSGFARKPLAAILAEIEDAARLVFGPGIIQTPESPLGQLNGLAADIAARAWEMGEDVYQSYDPDQAEGTRLDTLAKLRLLARAAGESDAALRQAIGNAGRARVDLADIVRAVRNLPGVAYAQVFVNDGDGPDDNGLAGHSLALAVIGGDDAAIAATLRAYVVPGIGTFGNVRVETAIDGVCRSIFLARPVPVPVTLQVTVTTYADRNGCPPPAPAAIAAGLATALTGATRPLNGDAITLFLLRQAIESRFANVEVVSAQAARTGKDLGPLPLALDFLEIAEVDVGRVVVVAS